MMYSVFSYKTVRIPSISFMVIFLSVASSELWAENDWRRKWHLKEREKPLKIDLVEVRGGLAFLSSGSSFGHFPIGQFEEEDQALIRSFEQEQNAQKGRLWSESTTRFWKKLEAKLFAVEKGKRVNFSIPEGKAEPDFYVFYFGASWCGPCHRFMPKLLMHYNRWRAWGFENFEVIFVSWDESRSAQINYYEEFEMPFHLMELRNDESLPELRKVRPSGIPALVVFDREGNPLYHTYKGSEYRGAMAVIEELNDLLIWSNPENPLAVSFQFSKVRERVLKQKPWGENAPARVYRGGFTPELTEQLKAFLPTKLLVRIATNGSAKLRQSELPPELERAVKAELADWYFIPAMENGAFIERSAAFPLGE